MATPYNFDAQRASDVLIQKPGPIEGDPPLKHDTVNHGVKPALSIPDVAPQTQPRVIYFSVDESNRSSLRSYIFADNTNELIYTWHVRLPQVGLLKPGTKVYWFQNRFQGQPGGGASFDHGVRGFGNPSGQEYDLFARNRVMIGNVWGPGTGVWAVPLCCTVTKLDFFLNGELSLHRLPQAGHVGFLGLSGVGQHFIFVEPGAKAWTRMFKGF